MRVWEVPGSNPGPHGCDKNPEVHRNVPNYFIIFLFHVKLNLAEIVCWDQKRAAHKQMQVNLNELKGHRQEEWTKTLQQ